RRARMLPFHEACEGLERTARDLARTTGKEVELFIHGSAVEMDRSILEALRDPLQHLVRNAIDHGIEPTAERQPRAKRGAGRIEVAAELRGAMVDVVVSDDGRGLAVEAIRAQASRRGVPVPEEPGAIARLLFVSGFSTAQYLTQVSGRGVGLDVVKH